MKIEPSGKLASLGFYAFAEVDKAVAELKSQGIEPIDFGVGDPIEPTPRVIREALKQGADEYKSSGYPSYVGSREYREAIASWTKKRFGVELDSESQITSTIGSKEAVFHFPLAFLEPGDVVLSPNPGYPPYQRGTLFAGGENYLLNLLPENNFLPDLKAVPEAICQRAKILWLNYPSNPCAVDASEDFYREAIEFCKRWGIILVSDECYTEIYFDTAKRPHSILEFCQATDPVVSIFSLSKRSNMTGYRVGWVAGNTEIIAAFKKVKTNIDSGTPTFIQKAAIAALNDEEHVEAMRNLYNQKREILIPALKAAGFPDADLEATFYLWQPIPSGFKDSVELAKRLLAPEIGVIVTPGQWISDTFEGVNPGQKFVRFALVPSVEETKRAAERIAKSLK